MRGWQATPPFRAATNATLVNRASDPSSPRRARGPEPDGCNLDPPTVFPGDYLGIPPSVPSPGSDDKASSKKQEREMTWLKNRKANVWLASAVVLAGLSLSGCATEQYVDEHIATVN